MPGLLAATTHRGPLWPGLAALVVGAVLFDATSAGVSGGFPRDVELIEPVTGNQQYDSKVGGRHRHHHHLHYPSYVKGQDPVEEYNRRRLHVDTSEYMDGLGEPPTFWDGRRQLEVEGRALRERYGRRRRPEVESGRLDKKVGDRAEIERVKSAKGRKKVRDPIKRVGRHVVKGRIDAVYPRRYEESDPQVFPYERMGPGMEVENRRQGGLPEDTKFFQSSGPTNTEDLENTTGISTMYRARTRVDLNS